MSAFELSTGALGFTISVSEQGPAGPTGVGAAIAANSFLANPTNAAASPIATNAATAKLMLSLNNVDNTSDANKPISYAQQTALDGKVSLTGFYANPAWITELAHTKLTGLGTGVSAALAINLGAAGALVTNNTANTFVGNQAVTGNLTVSGSIVAGNGVQLTAGGSGYSGYIEFTNPTTLVRQGYMGFSNGTGISLVSPGTIYTETPLLGVTGIISSGSYVSSGQDFYAYRNSYFRGTDAVTRVTIAGDTGNITVTGSIGYGTGAGGVVTQITSRSTGVTLNKVSGAITLVSNAGSTTPATFVVTNSTISATDTVIVNQKSGTDIYLTFVTNVGAGQFSITFYTTGGTTTEQPVFNFNVLKGVAA